MASHKTLKSVVASLAQSFTSLMNYRGGDYVMGHIVYAAWSTGATRLRVNLRSGVMEASPLLVPEVRDSLTNYVRWFPDIVERSNSSMDFIREAELLVIVDPATRRPCGHSGFQESPFTCSVRVVDDRGKEYVHEIKGWWFPEKAPPRSKKKGWLRLW